MNPPSALHGAMGRERKPFTYLPGGLDLSQIKSEKMAKRLMRNAMCEGVPERPVQNVQSPTTPTTPIPVPNFNCLPVQVFPTFQLPVNPKSLLRTRSTTNQFKDPVLEASQQQNTLKNNFPSYNKNVAQAVNNNGNDTFCKKIPECNEMDDSSKNVKIVRDGNPCENAYKQQHNVQSNNFINENNNQIEYRPECMYMYSAGPDNYDSEMSRQNCGPVRHVEFNPLRENNINQESHSKQYESESTNDNFVSHDKVKNRPVSMIGTLTENEYNKMAEIVNESTNYLNGSKELNMQSLPYDFTVNDDIQSVPVIPSIVINNNNELKPLLPSEIVKIRAKSQERNIISDEINNNNNSISTEREKDNSVNILAYEDKINDTIAELNSIKVNNDKMQNNSTGLIKSETSEKHQSQVTTSKQVTKQTKTEETNKEIENGDADTEAELTVQLPQKKSAAKTETKVEIVKKTLPDGGVQEIKTTTTTTTIDGRTEIKTRTETKTIPKETEEEFEEEEEEFEEEESGNLEEKKQQNEQKIEEIKQEIAPIIEIEQSNAVITKEERSESTTTKKVVVSSTTENNDKEVEEEEEVLEEEEEEEEETNEVKESKPSVLENEQPKPQENVEVEDELEEVVEEEEEEIEDAVEDSKENVKNQDNEHIVSEKREDVASLKEEKYIEEPKKEVEDEEEVEEEEEEYEEAEEDVTVTKTEAQSALTQDKVEVSEEQAKNTTSEIKEINEKEELKVESQPHQEEKTTSKREPIPEPKPTTREVPILFDKVEDIEIKPIGPASEAISRTRTESTEIITSKDNYGGPISTQTELHRVENIVVQNRITKTLDQSYEQLTQQGLPTVKTYFVPPREPVSISPQPSKPFQSSYTDPNERRHSLLLDRLSVDRQIPPPEQYQVYNNSTFETQNLNHEPQSEVLTVSNVKPSMITNQQWYQQTNKENVIYNNVPPSTPAPSQQQYQPQATTQPQFQAPTQPQYQAPAQPQYQAPTQPQYRAPAQPQYQASTQPQHHAPTQPQYQAPAQPQYQIPSQQIYQEQTQPQYQTPTQPLYQTQQVPQYQPPQAPQYQPLATTYHAPQPSSFTTSNYSKTSNSFQQNSFPSYTPTPSDWANHDLPSLNTQSQYTFQNKESTDSYKEDTQQYTSSYVPPPWEQDSSAYVPETPQQYYQPPSQNQTQNTAPEPGWKPAKAQAKFSKPPPTAYVPPAPNQSFVKPVTKADTPRIPGRKTYYSEYERRYISVPETMYVPAETKYQPQPDPSPQYYYDNDEAAEKEEHAWRKELREFTEKSSQTQYSTESVRPPWEEQQVYPKTPATPATYTPTPTWSQTLRPRSGRERTFESDYGSQEWPKSNTTSRGRPLSTYAQSNVTRKVERTRGVSVDRYNPNSYKSPTLMEHPPVQSHTLTPASAPPIKFHANPQVPAYHNSRASAEPREQSETYQQNPRSWGDSRASPLQSRSFKYLQWITGTDE